MKEIIIKGKHGGKVLVDADNYEKLSKYVWSWSKNIRGKVYARRSWLENGKKKHLLMHRAIMDVNDPAVIIDHIDGNGFNNQINNLRIVTRSQNIMNSYKPKTKNPKSIYKGVSKWIKHENGFTYEGWRASCCKNGKTYSKGHKTEISAALWYNKKAIELHGEYAILNVIPEEDIKKEKLTIPLDTLSHKVCRQCKELKSKDLFHKNESKADGLTSYCNKCIAEKKKTNHGK